jgi:serine phosphatase RsbU (regulator of sigma subunit)/FixJ family two-component response regulator
MEKLYVLFVDDDTTLLSSIKHELSVELGPEYVIETADSAESALEVFDELREEKRDVAVIVTDQVMPRMKGDEFLIRIHRIAPEIKKILLTGRADAEAVGNAVNHGGLYNFIAKPWQKGDLALTVKQAANAYVNERRLKEKQRLMSDVERYVSVLSEEIRLFPWMEKLLRRIVKDADCNRALFHVILHGQSFFMQCDVNGDILVQEINKKEFAARFPAVVFDRVAETLQPFLYDADRHGVPAEWSLLGSFYCVPFERKERCVATLYLESEKKRGHFTPKRIEFINTVVAQAAVSLENALLYESVEQKVRDRTRLLDLKNRDVETAVEYARKIQYAILPDASGLEKYFSKAFVWYEAKDVVSGDFYWFGEKNGFVFIAAVDCTGHGVPGAFMSVLGYALLNQVIMEQGIVETDQILYALHERVVSMLSRKQKEKDRLDGMDVALCRFDLKKNVIRFSGANRPLLHYGLHGMTEYKPARHAVGSSYDTPVFHAETIKFTPGDSVYLFTDGLGEQIGGDKRQKFSYRRVVNTIEYYAGEPLEKQKEMLVQAYNDWRGTYPQTDDLLVIGVRP